MDGLTKPPFLFMMAGQLDKSLGLEDVAGIDKAKAQVPIDR